MMIVIVIVIVIVVGRAEQPDQSGVGGDNFDPFGLW